MELARTYGRYRYRHVTALLNQAGWRKRERPHTTRHLVSAVDSHGRLLAAKAIGLAEAPTIALPGLTDVEKRALRLANNKIALGAGWDLDLLKIELADISALDVDLDLTITGFSTGELDVILSPADEPEDDVIPSIPATPRAKLGDIWVLGEHRIGCGDGRDPKFVQAVIGQDNQIDAAFLDSPYNVRINGHANAKGRHREFAMASGEMSDADFRTFLKDTLGMNSMPKDKADMLVSKMGLPQEAALVLAESPTKIWEQSVPTDPCVYRLYEIVGVYGTTIKDLIQEEFGDGIMSAIDFEMYVTRVEDPKGDRVKLEMSGKYLTYKSW